MWMRSATCKRRTRIESVHPFIPKVCRRQRARSPRLACRLGCSKIRRDAHDAILHEGTPVIRRPMQRSNPKTKLNEEDCAFLRACMRRPGLLSLRCLQQHACVSRFDSKRTRGKASDPLTSKPTPLSTLLTGRIPSVGGRASRTRPPCRAAPRGFRAR